MTRTSEPRLAAPAQEKEEEEPQRRAARRAAAPSHRAAAPPAARRRHAATRRRAVLLGVSGAATPGVRATAEEEPPRRAARRFFCADCTRRVTLISTVDAGTEFGGGDCDGSFLRALASTHSNESPAVPSPPDAPLMAWRRMPPLSAASAASRCSSVSCAWPASDAISCAAASVSLVLCVKLTGFMAAALCYSSHSARTCGNETSLPLLVSEASEIRLEVHAEIGLLQLAGLFKFLSSSQMALFPLPSLE
ncbi:hypothetical protein PVAP13_2NG290103 [Panicum virgatum]|uniref:Uncharacterized protein n=1 Tax=Panicum virgatum TaxID=38727 RepID=A0A8T0VF82_PANVG|nr:hypothetical protein PVAP13_2NG290103 [Panicum virgatum]